MPSDSDAAPDDGPVKVIVTLSDSVGADDVPRVASQLEESGLEVEQVLDFIGQIVGTSPSAELAPLRAIDGVEAVEVEGTVQLPPPGSPIQ